MLSWPERGFIVGKWETYDHRFATPGYEWASMTGGRGILLDTPRLVVTFAPDPDAPTLELPPAADIEKLRGRLVAVGKGAPTAVLPSEKEFAELKEIYGFKRPTWMPDWQWTRVRELYDLDGSANTFPETMEAYRRWIDDLLGTEPRRWEGFNAADQLTLFYIFEKALPAPVHDHWRLYWTAWLMPHKATKDLVHNQYHQIYAPWRGVGSDYFDRTGDWRGNWSFYRESYTRFMSTMNFNHTAAVGALLGGRFIGSDRAIADGRFGLEHFPLRLWAWYDGTTQESIDHYYLAHTLTSQKMFADFGSTLFDRMMGESILLKSIEELAGCYHPNLRRFISTSTRATPGYVLQVQDGLQHIVDTLSYDGALTDLDKIAGRQALIRKHVVNKLAIIGHDLSPRRVAMQTVQSPWAPEWMANIVDRKALPYEMTMTFKQWGSFRTTPKWKKSYLANHYGMASYDLCNTTINPMALWERTDGKVKSAEELGLLLIRYGFNRTNLLDTMKGGTLGVMGGGSAILQHRNKMIVLTSPYYKLQSEHFNPNKTDIRSLQTTVGLLTVQDTPTWQVRVDGRPVTARPFSAKSSARITIRDGVSYIGLIPVPATDLGRTDEIVIHDSPGPVVMQSGGLMKEGLVIENYNYTNDKPLDKAQADWDKIDAAWGGFVVEMGDATEYKDFDAFEKHIRSVAFTTRWDPKSETLHVVYMSGGDTMELGFCPHQKDGPGDKVSPNKYFPYRRVNGKWPYLPAGIERETPLSIQGRVGRLEKNGAVLVMEPNQMGYVLTEPVSGNYVAANPLPDPTELEFRVPGGWRLEADGKLGLARLVVQPKENRISIDYAVSAQQHGPEMAKALLVWGPETPPAVTRNGKQIKELEKVIKIGGKTVFAIPLDDAVGAEELLRSGRRYEARLAARQAALGGKAEDLPEMFYEKGQEHYLLTKPRAGAWEFQRLWPGGTVWSARVGGLAIAVDGRLALRRLVVTPKEGLIDVDAPRYMYDATGPLKFDKKAKALVIFRANAKPKVILNEEPYVGDMPQITLDGKNAYVVPLYGGDPAGVVKGIQDRYREAMKAIAAPK